MGLNFWILLALSLVVALIILLPFVSKRVEEELELFVLIMGSTAVTVSGLWSKSFVLQHLQEALPIAITVLMAGLLFYFLQSRMKRWIETTVKVIGRRAIKDFQMDELIILK